LHSGSFSRLLVAGVVSECALLVAALAIGPLLGLSLFARLQVNAAALAYGLAATLPMLLVLWWCLRTGWAPMRRLVRLAEDQLRPYLAGASTGGIVLLSFMAGIGEEALFRGVIQAPSPSACRAGSPWGSGRCCSARRIGSRCRTRCWPA